MPPTAGSSTWPWPQLAGGLAVPLVRLREELLELLARLEADLDFPDEDVPSVDPVELEQGLSAAAAIVAGLQQQMDQRLDVSTIARAVLIGCAQCRQEQLVQRVGGAATALISHLPGTTRDYLTVELDLDGVRCLLVDTAGVEPQRQERKGSSRRHNRRPRGSRSRPTCDCCAWIPRGRRPRGSATSCGRTDDPQQLVVLTKIDAAARGTSAKVPRSDRQQQRYGGGVGRIAAAVAAAAGGGGVVLAGRGSRHGGALPRVAGPRCRVFGSGQGTAPPTARRRAIGRRIAACLERIGPM